MIESPTMSALPAIPDRLQATPAGLEAIERNVARAVAQISDLGTLEEWRAQAAALETYLRTRNMAGPMLGAQRRVEARIGQLLGDPEERRGGRGNLRAHPEVSDRDLRRDAWLLARALNGEVEIAEDEWRASRRALVKLIRERLSDDEADQPQAGPRKLGQQRKLVASIVSDARGLASIGTHLDLAAIRQLPDGEEMERWRNDLAAARTTLSRLLGALSRGG